MGKFDEGKLPTDPHLMLRLAIETVAHDYDVIVIDSAPNRVSARLMSYVLLMC